MTIQSSFYSSLKNAMLQEEPVPQQGKNLQMSIVRCGLKLTL
jgi:hypothetical protein